mgnify:CR=1 FL=1
MTVTYGFYNSVASDRLYDAVQLSRLLEGVIEDGVFPSIGNKFETTVVGGMTVAVGSGRAWFNNTWTYNDSGYSLVVQPSQSSPRWDIVALEVNAETSIRANSLKIIKGTASSVPVLPTLTRTSTINQYPLAYIYVRANTSSILQSDITNKVGSVVCPWVSGPLAVIKTNELIYIKVFWHDENVTIGDGKLYFMVPPYLSGIITDVDISVKVPSTNGLPTVQIANCGSNPGSSGTDILSTKVTIDLNEFSSLTAATQPVILNPNIASQDWLRVDVDVAGTGTMGLDVILIIEKTS